MTNAEPETGVHLFNGVDLTGWRGQIEEYWSVDGDAIKARNDDPVATSTYLFTERTFRSFRLILEVRQTRAPGLSTMHSAVAALGEQITDRDNEFGFRGPLLMFCGDWGLFDANRRARVYPAGQQGSWEPSAERIGEWNLIEILVLANRIRVVANAELIMDFTDRPGILTESPIGLQLHANDQPQEFRFRGLTLTEDPENRLLTHLPRP